MNAGVLDLGGEFDSEIGERLYLNRMQSLTPEQRKEYQEVIGAYPLKYTGVGADMRNTFFEYITVRAIVDAQPGTKENEKMRAWGRLTLSEYSNGSTESIAFFVKLLAGTLLNWAFWATTDFNHPLYKHGASILSHYLKTKESPTVIYKLFTTTEKIRIHPDLDSMMSAWGDRDNRILDLFKRDVFDPMVIEAVLREDIDFELAGMIDG